MLRLCTGYCNSECGDGQAGIGPDNPSGDTGATSAAGPAAASSAIGLDLPGDLQDLRLGPWEVEAPGRSSLGGDAYPLRGAYSVWIAALLTSLLIDKGTQGHPLSSLGSAVNVAVASRLLEGGETLGVGQISVAEPGHFW